MSHASETAGLPEIPGGNASPDSPFPPAASPATRKMARDLGIDLRCVKGSEPGGRVVLEDVRNYIRQLQRLAPAPAPAKPLNPPSPDFAQWGAVTRRPMSPLRRTISHRMHEAWTSIPHVTQFDEADISRILDLRAKHRAAWESEGVKLTVTVFVLRALAVLLRKHPLFNASLDEAAKEIVFKDYVHLGVAVETGSGLLVPVIRDADRKSMRELSRTLEELALRARERKVSLAELSGGSFTVTNQGGIGGGHFTPIINKPEVAILGLGRAALKPVVKDGRIASATLLPVCLSYDHRLIDGADAARFTGDFVAALENFDEMELNAAPL